MRELEGGLDVGMVVDGTRGRWDVSEIGDAGSVDVAVAAVIVIGVFLNEGVGGIEDAAGSSGAEVERKGALHLGALCVEIRNGGRVVECAR